MWIGEIKLFDVVRLVDGREGVVVEKYDVPGLPLTYEIELTDSEMEMITVSPEQSATVIWRAPER